MERGGFLGPGNGWAGDFFGRRLRPDFEKMFFVRSDDYEEIVEFLRGK